MSNIWHVTLITQLTPAAIETALNFFNIVYLIHFYFSLSLPLLTSIMFLLPSYLKDNQSLTLFLTH